MKQFNIHEFLKTRPLSWSAISSFEYNPDQWYRRYILKEETTSPEMEFGKLFAQSCESRKPMAPVTLLSRMEQDFKVTFNKIPLIGFADTYDDVSKKIIGEYKTSKNPWTQEKVDAHGQITMYALMNYITHKVKPEDTQFFLESVLTESRGDYTIALKKPIEVLHFDTKRTMKDILAFGARINTIVKEMEAHVRLMQLNV